MIIDRTNINEIVSKTNTKPDKDYGQNFLVVPEVARAIVEALDVQKEEKVLEIGPGLGSLTHFLADKSNLTVCDIDSRMIDFLKGVYPNITYILNDIRKVDVSTYDKIIGNLPYNITTELVTYLLMNARKCKKMVLMCQQEAFLRFFDVSGGNYGPASILLHLLGDIKKLMIVKPGNFYPAPKINSLVFSFTYSDNANFDSAIKVYKFAKSMFLNRRKTIYNNLRNYLGDGDKTKLIIDRLGISNTARPEELSPNIYFKLYNSLS